MEKNKQINGVVPGANSEAEKVVAIVKKVEEAQQKAMELPQVIKTVEQLFKKVQQRDRLETYKEQLDSFDIKKVEDDLEPVSHYVGCKLEITDDTNSKFLLRHPVVIKEVIEFIKGRFTVKLAEVEAEIKLPINQAA